MEMTQHLARTSRLLEGRYSTLIFGFMALLTAASAMALPAPGVETGYSAVLIVGAIALWAGHVWGILVVAVAEVLVLGDVWPIALRLFSTQESDLLARISATVALGSALPGLILFAATLPMTVGIVLGDRFARSQPLGIAACSLMVAVWVLRPAFAAF